MEITQLYSLMVHYQPAIVLVFALLLDKYLGEISRLHPLVGFGRWAAYIETRCYGDQALQSQQRRIRGVFALVIAVLPWVLAVVAIMMLHIATVQFLLELVILYFALGAQSLKQHALAIVDRVQTGDIEAARTKVGYIVSRDTTQMTLTDIVRASVESVLENGNDAVFGALFWYLLAGAPGVLGYRLVNTLDAMWGYRNERYHYFGWAAARLDDLLNWLPSRLCALTYALLGNFRLALSSWRAQAPHWDSPNAGPVMAAGAGALAITLGGEASYDGVIHRRPLLGQGPAPSANDIKRALKLVSSGAILWAGLIIIGYWYCA